VAKKTSHQRDDANDYLGLKPKQLDSKSISEILATSLFFAILDGKDEIGLPIDIAQQVVKHLKTARRSRGNQRKSWGDIKNLRNACIKAKRHKEELIKTGMSAGDAEYETAKLFAKSLKLRIETFRRAMQNKIAEVD
jgi:hypothetical protein